MSEVFETEHGKENRSTPAVSDEVVDELLQRAQSQGSDLLGPDGLWSAVPKQVLERALETELTDHLDRTSMIPLGGHRAKATRELVTSPIGQLPLIFLPGYAPQRNPDKWVCKNVTHDQLGRRDSTDRAELQTRAIGALRRLQKLSRLIREFFADPTLGYTTE